MIAPTIGPEAGLALGADTTMKCGTDAFKNAMRLLVGGVTLLTTADGDERRGMTATAVCSLSATPPRLLACVNLQGSTYRVMSARRALTVNVLGAHHETLARRFGGARLEAGVDPFEAGDWQIGVNGAPRLADAPAAFECSVEEMIVTRTHAIAIGKVRNVVIAGEALPLIYVNGRFQHVDATDHVPLSRQ
jgi:flavin reductase (DIM6/NTAB) family NADH-FMN oxidoreductase RutF